MFKSLELSKKGGGCKIYDSFCVAGVAGTKSGPLVTANFQEGFRIMNHGNKMLNFTIHVEKFSIFTFQANEYWLFTFHEKKYVQKYG